MESVCDIVEKEELLIPVVQLELSKEYQNAEEQVEVLNDYLGQ